MRLEIQTMPGVRSAGRHGIASGEVIAGNVGSERRMHYAVVGDSVNVAARLQAVAGPGQILVDRRPTTRSAGRRTQDLGNLRLAGKRTGCARSASSRCRARRPSRGVDSGPMAAELRRA